MANAKSPSDIQFKGSITPNNNTNPKVHEKASAKAPVALSKGKLSSQIAKLDG